MGSLTPDSEVVLDALGAAMGESRDRAVLVADALEELGFEIVPFACPVCGRWLSMSCSVHGLVGD
jgi:hypothetical protein